MTYNLAKSSGGKSLDMMTIITWAVIIVGSIALALMIFLTVKIYTSENPKQRASVEPEVDDNNELT